MCLRPVVHLIKETNHGIGRKSLANKYLAQEEVFGPVLGVLKFHEEELIALANPEV
jgi:acyl-CoA reductase-like NAD-dependent aldehyde dehydrogenase